MGEVEALLAEIGALEEEMTGEVAVAGGGTAGSTPAELASLLEEWGRELERIGAAVSKKEGEVEALGKELAEGRG